MWMRIFSSDIRARYSLEVAPSAIPRNREVVFLLVAVVDNDFTGALSSKVTYLLTALLCVVICSM